MTRNRTNGTQYQIIYWRDIPAQIKIRVGRERSSQPLSERFQEAIDKAAMYAGKIDSDDYLEQWRTSAWEPYSGEAQNGAEKIVGDLEAEFSQERLREIAKRGGYEFLEVSRCQVVYWRDIPAQVKLRQGRTRLSRPLPNRFQDSIDRAAMEAGPFGSDAYLSEWRTSDWEERDGDPESVSQTLVAEIDQAYPRERLKAMIAALGFQQENNKIEE